MELVTGLWNELTRTQQSGVLILGILVAEFGIWWNGRRMRGGKRKVRRKRSTPRRELPIR